MRPSKIAYCDYSGGILNFVLGCTPVSAGCANCYARRIYDRFGKDFSKVTVYPEKLERLLKWQPRPPYKRGPGSRPLAFVVDMGDLFHDDVPVQFIMDFFDLAAERHPIDWLLLIKRPQRMRKCVDAWCDRWVGGRLEPDLLMPDNLWLGVTVENQDNVWRIDELLKTPTALRWVSLEPMLGPIDMEPYLGPVHVDSLGVRPRNNWDYWSAGLDWVVIGAESGPDRKRRPLKWDWAWDVLEGGRREGVPVFLKQHSAPHPGMPLLDRDGNEVKEWPR